MWGDETKNGIGEGFSEYLCLLIFRELFSSLFIYLLFFLKLQGYVRMKYPLYLPFQQQQKIRRFLYRCAHRTKLVRDLGVIYQFLCKGVNTSRFTVRARVREQVLI